MTEEELKRNVANNLTVLRKRSGMTQAELAEKLSYSDKSVSKWERADGVPDVVVLKKLAELYGVTLDQIVSGSVPKARSGKPHLTNRIIIPMLSVGLVFFIASIVFFGIKISGVQADKSWLVFLYAVPISCIPLIVFMKLWWRIPQRFTAVSSLIWSLVLCLRLSFSNENLNFAFITAAIMQVLVILWYVMRYRSQKRKAAERGQ